MTDIGNKVRTFIADCIAEYPAEADRIEVEISTKWGKCRVSLSNAKSPIYYSKEIKLAEIKERPDIKAVALEVYK